MNRIDPDGMDEYILNRDGKLILALKTKAIEDNVYAMNKDGGVDKKNTMQISKDVINSKVTKTIKTKDSNNNVSSENVDIFTSFGDKQSTDFFEFMAKNTDVEWTQVKATVDEEPGYEEVNYIGTGHTGGEDASQSYIADFIPHGVSIREANHNHPNGTTWVSQGDHDVATKIQARFPNAKFNIYSRILGTEKYQYTQYDMFSTQGLIKEAIVKPSK